MQGLVGERSNHDGVRCLKLHVGKTRTCLWLKWGPGHGREGGSGPCAQVLSGRPSVYQMTAGLRALAVGQRPGAAAPQPKAGAGGAGLCRAPMALWPL